MLPVSKIKHFYAVDAELKVKTTNLQCTPQSALVMSQVMLHKIRRDKKYSILVTLLG